MHVFDYPQLGFDLLCLESYMYVGDRDGNLPIQKRDMPFGKHLFEAGKSKVVQIGDERGSAVWEMLKLIEGNSLLYLGVLRGERGEMLIFQPLEDDEPKIFARDLFGTISGLEYFNLLVAFNYLDADTLHITTRSVAGRVFRPTVVFAD